MRIREKRLAFTLIELLVVLSIIAVLTALSAAAIMRFRGVGQAMATKTNLGKIHSLLQTQWKAIADKAAIETKDPVLIGHIMAKYGLTNQADLRFKDKYVELRLLVQFPMTFQDAHKPDGNIALRSRRYKDYLEALSIMDTTPAATTEDDKALERSVCLLMILEKGEKSSAAGIEDLGTNVVGPLPSVGNSKALGVIDVWKLPVVFTTVYQDKFGSIALLSAGPDGKRGVWLGAPPAPPLPPKPNLFIESNLDTRDNVLVFTP